MGETVLHVPNLSQLGDVLLRDQAVRTGMVSIGSDSRKEDPVLLVLSRVMGEHGPLTHFSG